MFDTALIIGMGSAGRRYYRLLRELGVKHIDVLRSGKATIKDEIVPAPENTFTNDDDAFKNKYDAVIICTPSSLHYKHIMRSLDNDINVLTEKPVSDNVEDLLRIKEKLNSSKAKFGVCHNLRYHPAIQSLKKYVDSGLLGKPICASVQFCAYLPDWHPWEDYKKSYAAKQQLGGGAALTHTHEIDYLNLILGKPVKYNGIKAEKKFIGCDTDECSVINIEHESGALSQILLSLNTKPPKRNIMIYFTKGRLEIDLMRNDIQFMPSGKAIPGIGSNLQGFNFEETYKDMLKDFDKLIQTGSSGLCTIDDAISTTKIVTEI